LANCHAITNAKTRQIPKFQVAIFFFYDQCYKLGTATQKCDIFQVAIFFFSFTWSKIVRFFRVLQATPIGARGQSYKLWDELQILSVLSFTGAKIVFFG
jgi:hypothetical protein